MIVVTISANSEDKKDSAEFCRLIHLRCAAHEIVAGAVNVRNPATTPIANARTRTCDKVILLTNNLSVAEDVVKRIRTEETYHES